MAYPIKIESKEQKEDKGYFSYYPDKDFRWWQKKHSNMITPHIRSVLVVKGNIVIEKSEGTGMNNEPMYGVSVFKQVSGDKFESYGDYGQVFYDKKQADKYAKELQQEIFLGVK
jgi:hypothetical protein